MKPSKLMIVIFAAIVAVQLAVPASLIIERELTLQHGVAYKFKTAPVDPADAFRGRYVALNFEQHSAPVMPGQKFATGEKAYATIIIGADGFARFSAVTHQPPADKPYLRVHVTYSYGPAVNLELPFDRYYVEEDLAPAAERAYREHSRRGQQDAYALVRLRQGIGVIETLSIGGQPIAEQLSQRK